MALLICHAFCCQICVEKCPTETYTPLGMAKLGAEPEPLIKARMALLICYAFCCQICVEKCPTETYTPLGMAKLGAEPEPLITAKMAFLIFYAFCRSRYVWRSARRRPTLRWVWPS
jgi:hypothetical protein